MSRFTRRTVLAASGAAIATPVWSASRLNYDLAPKQVASGIWMIEGVPEYFTFKNGGAIVNCTLIETDDGMVLVDSGVSVRYGKALLDVVSQLGGKPVIEILITHHHPDHFFGNQAFEGVKSSALGKTVGEATQHADGYADNLYRLLRRLDAGNSTHTANPCHRTRSDHHRWAGLRNHGFIRSHQGRYGAG